MKFQQCSRRLWQQLTQVQMYQKKMSAIWRIVMGKFIHSENLTMTLSTMNVLWLALVYYILPRYNKLNACNILKKCSGIFENWSKCTLVYPNLLWYTITDSVIDSCKQQSHGWIGNGIYIRLYLLFFKDVCLSNFHSISMKQHQSFFPLWFLRSCTTKSPICLSLIHMNSAIPA